MKTARNVARIQPGRRKGSLAFPGSTTQEGIAPTASEIIARSITLSPLSRELIRKHIDALGSFGIWPSRFTVVAEAFRPLSPAEHAVRIHVIIDGPGLRLSVMRKSGEGPDSRDLRIAVKCCFVAVEAELMRRAGMHR